MPVYHTHTHTPIGQLYNSWRPNPAPHPPPTAVACTNTGMQYRGALLWAAQWNKTKHWALACMPFWSCLEGWAWTCFIDASAGGIEWFLRCSLTVSNVHRCDQLVSEFSVFPLLHSVEQEKKKHLLQKLLILFLFLVQSLPLLCTCLVMTLLQDTRFPKLKRRPSILHRVDFGQNLSSP